MTRNHDRDPAEQVEPWVNDGTPFNLNGLGVENVPMTYRGLLVAFLILATLTLGFFGVVHYWRWLIG
jgi:hypothetical protein